MQIKTIILIGLVAILIGVSLLWKFLFPKDVSLTSSAIESYLDGDSLIKDKLESFQENWNKLEPEIKKNGGNFFTGIFGGEDGRSIIDSSEYKLWEKTKKSIDSAIFYRSIIDQKFFKIIQIQNYRNHDKIKESINKIPESYLIQVNEELGDISKLALKQISNKIDQIVTKLKTEKSKETKKNGSRKLQKYNNLESIDSNESNTSNRDYESQKAWENEFWELIYKGDISRMDFDHWYIKGSNIPTSNPYKIFYIKYINGARFYRFQRYLERISIIEKKHIKNLNELKEQIK